ncbi:unnamed protein product [Sphagnum balticum]
MRMEHERWSHRSAAEQATRSSSHGSVAESKQQEVRSMGLRRCTYRQVLELRKLVVLSGMAKSATTTSVTVFVERTLLYLPS